MQVSELDFKNIKQNLKTYLQGKPEFSDYNFDGSTLSYILDILAYNTHYNGIHTNFAFSETFLDSALVRSSVVSRAKEIGYTPRSKTASKAKIRVSYSVSGNPQQHTLPKGTKFTTNIGDKSYTFQTTIDYLIEKNSSDLFVAEIDVYEGKFNTFRYVITNPIQNIVIPSKECDTQFLKVEWKESQASITVPTEYSYIDTFNIGDLDGNSEVYFLKENFDGFFEVYFGDGVIGKEPETNNIIDLTYLITSGQDANGAKTFSLSSTIPNVVGMGITTLETSVGGSEKETINSIKYLAPFYYASQKRAVTENDYKALIKNRFGFVDDLIVWGGEKNNPPQYGKVFIAVKPTSSYFLSNSLKEQIKESIDAQNTASVRPDIVDADYIYVFVDVVGTYDSKKYDRSGSFNLETAITNSINSFFTTESNKFGKSLAYSKLVNTINDSSDVLLLANVNLRIQKNVPVYLNSSTNYSFEFSNSIQEHSLRSNALIINGESWYITDIPVGTTPFSTGKLVIYRDTVGGRVYLSENCGTINYNTGSINIVGVRIDDVDVDLTGQKTLSLNVAYGTIANTTDITKAYNDFNVYTNERGQLITLYPNGITLTLLPG